MSLDYLYNSGDDLIDENTDIDDLITVLQTVIDEVYAFGIEAHTVDGLLKVATGNSVGAATEGGLYLYVDDTDTPTDVRLYVGDSGSTPAWHQFKLPDTTLIAYTTPDSMGGVSNVDEALDAIFNTFEAPTPTNKVAGTGVNYDASAATFLSAQTGTLNVLAADLDTLLAAVDARVVTATSNISALQTAVVALLDDAIGSGAADVGLYNTAGRFNNIGVGITDVDSAFVAIDGAIGQSAAEDITVSTVNYTLLAGETPQANLEEIDIFLGELEQVTYIHGNVAAMSSGTVAWHHVPTNSSWDGTVVKVVIDQLVAGVGTAPGGSDNVLVTANLNALSDDLLSCDIGALGTTVEDFTGSYTVTSAATSIRVDADGSIGSAADLYYSMRVRVFKPVEATP